MDCVNINFLVVVLYYTNVSYYCGRTLGEGYMGSLCIISYNGMEIYNNLKIKSLKNLLNSGPRIGISALI